MLNYSLGNCGSVSGEVVGVGWGGMVGVGWWDPCGPPGCSNGIDFCTFGTFMTGPYDFLGGLTSERGVGSVTDPGSLNRGTLKKGPPLYSSGSANG